MQARLRTWEALRTVYMPGLVQYWQDIGEDPLREVEPEDKALWLPSALPTNRRLDICHHSLADMELILRTGQLADMLSSVRHTLRVKARMVQFKNRNIRGQRSGTRSRAIIDNVHDRVKSAAHRYRVAREARLALEGEGSWCLVYRELRNEDVRSYQDPARFRPSQGRRGTEEDVMMENGEHGNEGEDEIDLFPGERDGRAGTGETRRLLSWIWTTPGLSGDDGTDSGDDILRAEWCRSRARVNRATEEVRRLHEEMRRTLAFLSHQGELWERRKDDCVVDSPSLREGLKGYAAKQSSLQTLLSDNFTQRWKEPLGVYSGSMVNDNDDEDDDDDNEDDDDDDEDSNGRDEQGDFHVVPNNDGAGGR